jgi:hypothetical protein
MQQIDQRDATEASANCVMCRAPMRLMGTEVQYPGYSRRLFECPVCGQSMTQWASVSPASDEKLGVVTETPKYEEHSVRIHD